jgi:hypothetical protein
MSKIHETAVAIRDCLQIQRVADERSLALSKLPQNDLDADGASFGVLADNASRVCSDAGFLVHTFEQELTAYVPETPADMLSQMLVLAEYFHAHQLEEGSDAETVVRLLIGRLLEGLVHIAGAENSPLFDGYFNPRYTWPGRLAETRSVAREPSAAA